MSSSFSSFTSYCCLLPPRLTQLSKPSCAAPSVEPAPHCCSSLWTSSRLACRLCRAACSRGEWVFKHARASTLTHAHTQTPSLSMLGFSPSVWAVWGWWQWFWMWWRRSGCWGCGRACHRSERSPLSSHTFTLTEARFLVFFFFPLAPSVLCPDHSGSGHLLQHLLLLEAALLSGQNPRSCGGHAARGRGSLSRWRLYAASDGHQDTLWSKWSGREMQCGFSEGARTSSHLDRKLKIFHRCVSIDCKFDPLLCNLQYIGCMQLFSAWTRIPCNRQHWKLKMGDCATALCQGEWKQKDVWNRTIYYVT